MLSAPPAVPGSPGSSVPPLLMVIAEAMVPLPASVPALLTVSVVALLPVEATISVVPPLTLTALMPVNLLPAFSV